MATIAQHTLNVTPYGQLQIVVELLSQNEAQNTSYVQVRGWLINTYSERVSHPAKTITCQITGNQEWIGTDGKGGKFSYDLDPGESLLFIEHAFNMVNNADGTLTATYSVGYGVTGFNKFGDNQSVSVSLDVTRIPKRPSVPGQPTVSNLTTSSLTLSWTASTDNGGKTITDYLLRRWNSTDTVGSYIDSHGNNLSRTITGLNPGATYTFEVFAYNGVKDNNGYSNGPGPTVIAMQAGAHIRSGGSWHLYEPYVRDNGVWRLAIPYVRSGGVWKQTD
jgi:hypothetical protein